MKTFWFSVVVNEEITEKLTDQLFEAGCDDGTVSASQGVWKVGFAREAADLETAFRTAISDVTSVGLTVRSVTLESEEIKGLITET